MFVSLGVKGSDKTIQAFTQVKTGLSGIASTSLETKAAIIGVMYALEQMMSESAQRGINLSNFNALTGISVKQLQQWQYAARQAGESNEEFEGTLKAIQDKMAQMKLNKGQPEGLQLLASQVGFDVKKAFDQQNGIFYVLKKAQELIKTSLPTDVQNTILKSFGISEGTIAALRKGVFNATNFNRAPIYGDKEVDQLAKVNVLWGNLNQKILMLSGRFTAKYGTEIVGDISKIADAVFKVINAFTKLSEQLQIFKLIGEAFKGWEITLNKISSIVDKINPKGTAKEEKKSNEVLDNAAKNIQTGEQNPFVMLKGIFDNYFSHPSQEGNKINNNSDSLSTIKEFFNSFLDIVIGKSLYNENKNNNITPKLAPLPTTPNSQNTNINQNLYFQHEGKEHMQIKDSVHKAVGEAWKQSSAQSQAT